MTRKPLSKRVRFEILKRDSFKCQYCGASAPEVLLHVDHIKPLAEGGTDDDFNLITACVGCNLGKAAVLLSDSSAIEKQRSQLESLQERREQLEMLMEWKDGLQSIAQNSLEWISSKWEERVSPFHLNDNGVQSLRKLRRRFSDSEIVDAIEVSCDAYLKFSDGKPTKESVELAWDKIAGICRVQRESKDKPYIKDLYYARGILRKRLTYCDERKAIEWMEAAVSWGIPSGDLIKAACSVRNWSQFHEYISGVIADARRDRQ